MVANPKYMYKAFLNGPSKHRLNQTEMAVYTLLLHCLHPKDHITRIYYKCLHVHLFLQATFEDGRTRGLIDVCLQMQADDIREKGESWLSDDYIRGLMYDTTLAGN